MFLSEPLCSGLNTIYRRLEPQAAKWLVGGSCGLLLHGIKLERDPRDLDLYIDQEEVDRVHEALRIYATDQPLYSETPIYASILSHYQIEDNAVELVGSFRVHALDSSYRIEAAYFWDRHSTEVCIGESTVKVMPLAHELLFNVLRGRPDRYERIAEAMQQKPGEHFPALQDLLARNNWGIPMLRRLEMLLDCQL